MGFANTHLTHRGSYAHHKRAAANPNPTCSTGGFYKAPTSGQSIDSLQPLNITWDPTCLSANLADIYLYAPSLNNSRIYVWQSVDFTKGVYPTTLMPRWWNSSASISLQFAIIDAGTPPFLSTLPAGPVFTATYTKPASGPIPSAADVSVSDPGYTKVGNAPVAAANNMNPGKKAAAILLPLLFLFLIAGIVYLRYQRNRIKEKSKRFSQAVDKRMSVMSTDWRSMSAAGASAAIRNSIAVSTAGNRSSSFSFGAIRPVSTLDGGQAGIGARSLQEPVDHRPMSQLRPGVGLRTQPTSITTERVSRVSFAADPRPSGESRRTIGQSRAFHSSFIPPVPTRSDSGSDDGAMSPTQTQGPEVLSHDEIQARIGEEVMPALSMMRTNNGSNDELLFPPTAHLAEPEPEAPATQDAIPASTMSPDDMLRAYAARKAANASPAPKTPKGKQRMSTPLVRGMSISYPVPAASGGTGPGGRTVYAGATIPVQRVEEEDDNESAYMGTAA